MHERLAPHVYAEGASASCDVRDHPGPRSTLGPASRACALCGSVRFCSAEPGPVESEGRPQSTRYAEHVQVFGYCGLIVARRLYDVLPGARDEPATHDVDDLALLLQLAMAGLAPQSIAKSTGCRTDPPATTLLPFHKPSSARKSLTTPPAASMTAMAPRQSQLLMCGSM